MKQLEISLGTQDGAFEFSFSEKSNEELVAVTAKFSPTVKEHWMKVLVTSYLDEIVKGEWVETDTGYLHITFHLNKEDANRLSHVLKELQLKLSGFLNAN